MGATCPGRISRRSGHCLSSLPFLFLSFSPSLSLSLSLSLSFSLRLLSLPSIPYRALHGSSSGGERDESAGVGRSGGGGGEGKVICIHSECSRPMNRSYPSPAPPQPSRRQPLDLDLDRGPSCPGLVPGCAAAEGRAGQGRHGRTVPPRGYVGQDSWHSVS